MRFRENLKHRVRLRYRRGGAGTGEFGAYDEAIALNIARAKTAFAKHLGKLVLTPVQRDGRYVYRVSGNISVQPDADKCRMQVVARDGIQRHYIALSIPLAGVRLDPRAAIF